MSEEQKVGKHRLITGGPLRTPAQFKVLNILKRNGRKLTDRKKVHGS